MDFDITVLHNFSFSTAWQWKRETPTYSVTPRSRHLVQEFDLGPKHEIYPARLQLRRPFRALVNHRASDLSFRDSLPYAKRLKALGGPVEVVPQLEMYGQNYLVVSLRYHGRYNIANLEELLPKQSNVTSEITEIASPGLAKAVAMALTGSADRGLRRLPKRRVHQEITVNAPGSASSFDTHFARFLHDNRREIVALHISGSFDKIPDARLEAALVTANARLNLKSETQLMLVNAQGSTLLNMRTGLSAKSTQPGLSHHNRHQRAVDLSRVGAVFQQMLLESSSAAALDSSNWSPNNSIIHRWVRFPQNVFYTSVSNRVLWEAFSEAFSLPSLLDEFNQFD